MCVFQFIIKLYFFIFFLLPNRIQIENDLKQLEINKDNCESEDIQTFECCENSEEKIIEEKEKEIKMNEFQPQNQNEQIEQEEQEQNHTPLLYFFCFFNNSFLLKIE